MGEEEITEPASDGGHLHVQRIRLGIGFGGSDSLVRHVDSDVSEGGICIERRMPFSLFIMYFCA